MLCAPTMRQFVVFLAMLFIGVIPAGGATVSVQTVDSLWPAWQRLLAIHPLPSGMRAERTAAGGTAHEAVTGEIVLRIGAEPGFKVVENIVLSPVSRLGDPAENVRLDAVRAGSIHIEPLESVTLPDIALPVDGLFPDQPGYPLRGEAAVGLRSSDDALRAWFESLPSAAPVADTDIFWTGAVGDIMPARGVDEALLLPDGVQSVFGDTLSTLRSCPLLLGNLESAATAPGPRARKTYTFRFAPAALGELRKAGFSYLSLANNHTFDYGARGFLDTLANLAQWDLGTSGAGRNVREASLPWVARFGAVEVRILSFAAYPVDRTGFDGQKVARAAPDRPGTLWLD
jgi:hypothetical protein